MPTVYIPALLRDATRGRAAVEASGATIRQLILDLDAQFPGIRSRLMNGDELRSGIVAAVGTQVTSRDLSEPVPPDAEVHFLPAIGGG